MIRRLKVPYNLSCTIRGTVIDYQYMKTFLQRENSLNDIGDVLFFVVSRYYDDFFQKRESVDTNLLFFIVSFNHKFPTFEFSPSLT